MSETPSARWFDEWTEAQRTEYADRFRKLAASGTDIDGEARMVDAIAGRGSRILDAGCGAGRLSAYLAAHGHEVLGVDIDPLLVAAGRELYPGLPLQELDLRDVSPALGSFDIVASAGNVMVYLEPGSERSVLEALASVLRPGGRAVFGFATDRAYTHDQLDLDAASVGWTREARWATWELDPFSTDATWAVSLYRG
ncbi:class I SAM-dependent methyltransferase [Nocardioides jiangxiensis]|uniref:Class I SAM-dependent methyltransferase n=1 Tax=Nocardioides jiangxiensis TaxID=3064524 RepID=A0ABT9B0P1_9ACTN|nr:class I SAM-dependent methyltransferase [Nocardioides sp. WY-20]MDO7868300.1 class I SAM-dependent methyltransferase [Nocardioides sp. WY-20]